MAVSYTAFIPANLKPCWTNGANLKPSCTTDSYTGGNPTAPTQLKPSIVDRNGNLREGLVTATGLKSSLTPATPVEPPPVGDLIRIDVATNDGALRGARHPLATPTFGRIVDEQWKLELFWTIQVNIGNALAVIDFGIGGGAQPAGLTSFISLWDDGNIVLTYSWTGVRYETTSAALNTYLQANVGNRVAFRLTT